MYPTLFKKSSDEDRKERLSELGPTALDKGVEPGSAKYSALAECINSCGTGSSRIHRTPWSSWPRPEDRPHHVNAEKHPDETVVVVDDDHVGVLSRIIEDHASPGVTVTERNLADEIDWVVAHTLKQSWDNADDRNRGARRATATVFRKFGLKPVEEPYDSTVAYTEAHYLVD
ncbi:hypothetical protein LRS71_23515 [Rhodococcus pyridinivorans]|uniref:hypothetical protein n=1 Tax=Rhodococcus pyridinivorans TaxID=103816 RepID=UPI001E39EEFF|nr:hypothetical protein [Rhodococcus pyridinivorans]MCD5422485.1 hypothetical protein [Rhodococcus pyridinivorans]